MVSKLIGLDEIRNMNTLLFSNKVFDGAPERLKLGTGGPKSYCRKALGVSFSAIAASPIGLLDGPLCAEERTLAAPSERSPACP